MVNQYSTGAYPQTAQMYMQQKTSSPSIAGIMGIGALTGGTIGALRNRYPVGKDGRVSDEFAKEAFEKHVKKNLSQKSQEFFKQLNTLIKKAGKAKSADSLKKIIKENKSALALERAGITTDTYINAITDDNYKKTAENLKKELDGMNKKYYDNFKTITEACWDANSKKFTKPDGIQKNVFDVIRKTNTNKQLKKALKYGGITAGILGALTVGYKLVAGRYQV